jgi:hypothetical protein
MNDALFGISLFEVHHWVFFSFTCPHKFVLTNNLTELDFVLATLPKANYLRCVRQILYPLPFLPPRAALHGPDPLYDVGLEPVEVQVIISYNKNGSSILE